MAAANRRGQSFIREIFLELNVQVGVEHGS